MVEGRTPDAMRYDRLRDTRARPQPPIDSMPFLIIHESGHPNRLFELPAPRITIGRAPTCELVLANVSVSREHAVLESLPSGSAEVMSLASHNPVLVNDAPVNDSKVLEHGGSMRLGKFKLTWLHEDHLDSFRTHQLSEMPRFSRLDSKDSQATYALSGALQKKLLKVEALREFGAFTAPDGTVYTLGTDPIAVGPDDAIPCASRWGRRTAAVVEWAGSSHEVKLTGMFAKMTVNGETVASKALNPSDLVSINGTEFTYAEVRKKRS